MAGILKQSAQCNTCHENPKFAKRKRKFEQCEECRRDSIKTKLVARRVQRTVPEGSLVQYNEGDGWRVGYLVSFNSTKTAATVQPIGPKGTIPDTRAIKLVDIRPESGPASCRTVQDYYRMHTKKKAVVLVADRKATEYPPMSEAERAVLTPALVERPKNAIVTQAALPVTPIAAVKPVVGVPEKSTTTVPETSTPAVGRMKHAPVDLTEARRLYESGKSINEVVEAVKGTRAAFDVKKLVRKTLKELGILKD